MLNVESGGLWAVAPLVRGAGEERGEGVVAEGQDVDDRGPTPAVPAPGERESGAHEVSMISS